VRLGTAQGGPHAGSPLSPDGQTVVSTTSLGLFVSSPQSQYLVKTVKPVIALNDCVISNGGSRIACRAGDRTVLLTHE
jgi:hypothetical protein